MKRLVRRLCVASLLITTACTNAASDGTSTNGAESQAPPTTIDPVATLIDACRKELLNTEPSIERLALDPTMTNLALGLTPDQVAPAARQLNECFGVSNGATYLATDIIVGGQALPADAQQCLEPRVAAEGDVLFEVSLRRARLERPDDEAGSLFVDALVDCVPGRYLAGAVRAQDPEAYAVAVDDDCLDQAHLDDPEPLRQVWALETFGQGGFDPSQWSDAEAATNAAPLYRCVDTGAFIASDPTIGADLSEPTRRCFSDVAQKYGYWESRLAQRDFNTPAYNEEIDSCLTPEEALVVLGTPLPVDDPVTSHFEAIASCVGTLVDRDLPPPSNPLLGGQGFSGTDETGADETELAAISSAELAEFLPGLVGCAGAEGVAGHYASIRYNNRALPQGSYDCFLDHFLSTSDEELLTAIDGALSFEAGRTPGQTAGDAYIEAVTGCIAPSIYVRPLLRAYAAEVFASVIDPACLDAAYPASSDETAALWQGLVFGGFGVDTEPTSEARAAVEPIYGCVSAGQGFADLVAADTPAELSQETIRCIDAGTRDLNPIESTIIGQPLNEDAFNAPIAECIPDEEADAIRGN